MTHYLVVAHRIDPTSDLVDALARLAALDTSAAFTLLVTATHHPLEEHNPRATAQALERGQRAREALAAAGLPPVRVLAGDGSPLVAAEDEIRARPEVYDAVALCTDAPTLVRRLAGDTRRRMEERLGLPVLHLYRGSPHDVWERERRGRLGRLWERTRLTERLRPGEWRPPQPVVPTRRELLPVVALMLVYLVGGLVLALTVNPGFYFTDAVALLVYTVVIGGLLLVLRRES